MLSLPNALGITQPPRVWKEQEGPGKAHIYSQGWMPPLPTQACGCPWSVDKVSMETTAFPCSWSLSLDWAPTTSLLGFLSYRWKILRLPMVQQAGLLFPSYLCALVASLLWTVCGAHFCARILPLASRGTWQPLFLLSQSWLFSWGARHRKVLFRLSVCLQMLLKAAGGRASSGTQPPHGHWTSYWAAVLPARQNLLP